MLSPLGSGPIAFARAARRTGLEENNAGTVRRFLNCDERAGTRNGRCFPRKNFQLSCGLRL